ncbi:DUF2877 domain-containing protein [Phytoactinopolyspora halotolerans]|uniref:DUF2877 domain-containing protein n=1 Tax=Phytoactinopolyspora halotolerans TaxID=1981512 RepID=A0A6L9S9T1_9ACTN|nr:DUF2877 domain-containing protein [Phytoactinopolyspora halotolerans]NEE02135.1 DUF2877 domain-containing protein [Phytoactinopolyspora halotolerans]
MTVAPLRHRTAPSSTRTTLAAAASTAVQPLLVAPPRRGHVVASTSDLLAVQVPGVRHGLICLTGTRAVRIPCAMVLAGPVPQIDVGTPVEVGAGRVTLPEITVSAIRWWQPRRPLVADPVGAVRRAGRCPAPDLDAPVLEAAAGLACALHSTALRLDESVTALLGLGPGLTPAGDDVLAGAVVAFRSIRSSVADELTEVISAAAPPTRTTAVSAALLRYACEGHCVPELARFLGCLSAPQANVIAAYRELLGVGHTSGAGLYAGVLSALAGPAALSPSRRRA